MVSCSDSGFEHSCGQKAPIVCQDEAGSPLVNQAVQSHPPIVCQDEAGSPLVNQAVQSRPPIVCQDEAGSPLINQAVQSRPPVLSQVQLPAQATITPSSVQAPFHQAITKEQMNFALSASNQGLFGASVSEPHTSELNPVHFSYIIIMAYGSTPYVGMVLKKNGGHIKSAPMTCSKFQCKVSQKLRVLP